MLIKKCQILIVNFFNTQKAIQIEVNFNFGWLFYVIKVGEIKKATHKEMYIKTRQCNMYISFFDNE